MGFGGPPAAKSRNFRGSFRRLLGELRPEALLIAFVMLLAIVSVVLAVIGPKILGTATDVLFAGVVGRELPPGITQEQAVDALRAAGQDNMADMLASMTNVVPGQGVDFDALAGILVLAALVYIASSLFAWAQGYIMAGVTQRTVYRLRRRVDEKLGRLPLAYFDRESRGDILSRVTNDIDNIGQTLQQSLTQLITAFFTVIGVLAMMFNCFFDLHNSSPVTPYLGGGIGFAALYLDNTFGTIVNGPFAGAGATLYWEDDDAVFAYQVGAGLEIALNRQLSLDVGYRYFGTDDANFTSQPFGQASLKLQSHNAAVGVRVKF
jgi:ABC-type multidrug transport system fused ATPase/permease subunit